MWLHGWKRGEVGNSVGDEGEGDEGDEGNERVRKEDVPVRVPVVES